MVVLARLRGRYEDRRRNAGTDKILDKSVAFRVHVRRDVMCNRACVMANADASVEARRAKPDAPRFARSLIDVPEPDMVAPIGTFARRLLEGEVLAASIIVKIAHWRVGVGAVEQDASTIPILDFSVIASAGLQPAA